MHRISDKRFTEMARRNFAMFRELCGDATLKDVILVTNMWGEISPEDGQDRESQLFGKFFKPVIDKGARMARHFNTTRSAHDIIRRIMGNHPVALQIQRELVDNENGIADTAAGEVINQEFNDQIKRYQAELKKVQAEMVRVLEKKDEEMRQELELDRRKMQEQMDKIKKNSEELASRFPAEKERMKVRMIQMEQEMQMLHDLINTPAAIPFHK